MRRKLRISCVRARMCVRRTIDHGDDPAPALNGLQQKIRNSFREALVPMTRRRPAILSTATKV